MNFESERNKINDIIKPYEEEIENINLNNDVEFVKEEGKKEVEDRIDKFQVFYGNLDNELKNVSEELNNKKENREKEINDYIDKVLNNNPNLEQRIVDMVRREKEQEYDAEMEPLEQRVNEIKQKQHDAKYSYGKYIEHIKNKTNNEVVSLEENEIIAQKLKLAVKFNARQKLVSAAEEVFQNYNALKEEYNQRQHDYNDLIGQLDGEVDRLKVLYARLEPVFSEDSLEVLNGDEYKVLSEQIISVELQRKLEQKRNTEISNKLLEQLNEYQKLVDEYNDAIIKMNKLTKEEKEIDKIVLTEEQQKELEKQLRLIEKKGTFDFGIIKEQVEEQNQEPDLENEESSKLTKIKTVKAKLANKSDMEDVYSDSSLEPIDVLNLDEETESIDITDSVEDVELTANEVLTDILNDIMTQVSNIKSVKLSNSELQVGEDTTKIKADNILLNDGSYLSLEDMLNATAKLKEKLSIGEYQPKTYVVKSINKTYKLDEEKINKFIKMIGKTSKISLVGNIGKNQAKTILAVENDTKTTYAGKIQTSDENIGDYSSAKEIAKILDTVFDENKETWKQKIANKLSKFVSKDRMRILEKLEENKDYIVNSFNEGFEHRFISDFEDLDELKTNNIK